MPLLNARSLLSSDLIVNRPIRSKSGPLRPRRVSGNPNRPTPRRWQSFYHRSALLRVSMSVVDFPPSPMADKKTRRAFALRASMAAPESAFTVSGTAHASLSFISPTSAHPLATLREEPMNSRFVKERKGLGFIGSDKAPAIPGQGSSSHRRHQGGYVRDK